MSLVMRFLVPFRIAMIGLFPVLQLLPSEKISAQEVEMSQFYSAPLHLNPALTGISYGPRVVLNYRNQWPSLGSGFNGGFTTYMASFDMHIQPIRGGIGLLFVGDQISDNLLATYRASLLYSQQFRFSRKVGMRIGIAGTYIYTGIKWNELQFSDMVNIYTGFYDPNGNLNPTGEPLPARTTVHTGDMNAGFVIFSNKLYGGFAVNNLLMHKESFSGAANSAVPMRFAVNFGATLPIKHRAQGRYSVFISPNLLFVNQGKYFQLNGTLLSGVSFMYFGLAYRHAIKNSDSVIGIIGFRKSKFRLAYSYDYTVSKLINRSGGSHELSFTFNWSGLDDNSLNPKINRNYIECPDILNF